MRTLAKRRSGQAAFLRLPAATKAMALEAALFLALARCLVAYVPLRLWRGRLATAPQDALPVPALAWRVAWIVGKVAAGVPFAAVCLPQAMAAQWMLRRRGVASQLVIGTRAETDSQAPAKRNAVRRFAYHAWLQVGGQCVIGGRIESYSAFPPFESATVRSNPSRSLASRASSQRETPWPERRHLRYGRRSSKLADGRSGPKRDGD